MGIPYKKRRFRIIKLILLYKLCQTLPALNVREGVWQYREIDKGLKGKARIPTDDLISKTRRGRNQHTLAFQIPSASKDVYNYLTIASSPRLSGTGMTFLSL